MNRLEFGISLFAAAFCIAFLGSTVTSERETAWSDRLGACEVQSTLLGRSPEAPAMRHVYTAPSPTASNWKRSTWNRAASGNLPATGRPTGARLTLVSFTNTSSVLDACGAGPDYSAGPISVAAGGYNNLCSTSAGQGTSGQCSVNASTAVGACSVDQNTGSTTSFCSAGAAGSPNNSTPSPCSANGNTNASTCSTNASGTANTPMKCSVMGKAGATNQAKNLSCSTSMGNGQSCSTGVNAGGSVQNNAGQSDSQCSTLSQSGGGNFCSVNGSGNAGSPNQCSADSSGTTICTASTSTAGDFCSVKQGQTNVTCTALPASGMQGNCSATGTATNQQCSVQATPPATQGTYGSGLCKL